MNHCGCRTLVGVFFALWTVSTNAALPLTWQVSNPPPTNRQLDAVTYCEGQFAAVGKAILTSPNGTDWMLRAVGSSDSYHLHAVAYGNGIYVAGGQEVTLTRLSSDGVDWSTGQTAIGVEQINGLTFARGIFVAVGHGVNVGTAYILTSPNGTSWQSQNPPTSNELQAIAYGNNLFVAVGKLGTIITSPNGTNWTVRNSGTSVALNAVAYTGSRFIAGGDSGITLSSPDGISWSVASPASFNVRGLAAGGGAVVAVGDYPNEGGRLHASPDGLTWPGESMHFGSPLRGVAYRPDQFVAVGDNGLILRSSGETPNDGTNSWTKPTSGNWEEPFWSLGELPSSDQAAIMFTNAGFKALAINHDTTLNYPASLDIRNLVVDASLDSSNLLLLNFAGLVTPLQVSENLLIGPRGALLDYASALRAGNLNISGDATFSEGADAQVNHVRLGTSSLCAALRISNATVRIGTLTNVCGIYRQTAGLAVVSNLYLVANADADANAFLTGGRLETDVVFVGNHNTGPGNLPGNGIFFHSGGLHTNTGFMIIDSFLTPPGLLGRSTYSLSGSGRLEAAFTFLAASVFNQSGGTNLQAKLQMTVGSRFTFDAGLMRVNDVSVFGPDSQGELSMFVQNGGSAEFSDLYLNEGGTYQLNGGSLSVSNLTLGWDTRFFRGNANFVQSEKFRVFGGTYYAGSGTDQFGALDIGAECDACGGGPTTSTIDFQPNGPSVLRFADSHNVVWEPGQLVIANWAGSPNGGGSDRVYVGTSSTGLSASQLRQIAFDGPPGLPPGIYRARILATGELVPDPARPVLAYSRTSNGLQLNWDTSCQLLSSTNVAGPYTPLSPQPASPYNVTFTDRQRFFEVRCQ